MKEQFNKNVNTWSVSGTRGLFYEELWAERDEDSCTLVQCRTNCKGVLVHGRFVFQSDELRGSNVIGSLKVTFNVFSVG